MAARISEGLLNGMARRVQQRLHAKIPGVEVTLHLGNRENRVPNYLIITVPRLNTDGSVSGSTITRQVWTDSMAGYTKQDAYRALRLMSTTLDLLEDFER